MEAKKWWSRSRSKPNGIQNRSQGLCQPQSRIKVKLKLKVKVKVKFDVSQRGSQMFDVRHSNVECQNNLNIQLCDVGYSNENCQNDRTSNVKLFDVRRLNDE